MRREIVRYIKYSLVGGVGNAVHFGSLYLLTEAGMLYLLSATIAIVLAASNNYALNHIWSFRDHREGHDRRRGWAKFVAAKLLGDVAYLALLWYFTSVLGIWYMFSAGLATAATAVPGYVLVAWWVWDRKVWKPHA